jgi:hypothetical protein
VFLIKYIFYFSVIFLLNSCYLSIEKRHFNSGYHVNFKSKNFKKEIQTSTDKILLNSLIEKNDSSQNTFHNESFITEVVAEIDDVALYPKDIESGLQDNKAKIKLINNDNKLVNEKSTVNKNELKEKLKKPKKPKKPKKTKYSIKAILIYFLILILLSPLLLFIVFALVVFSLLLAMIFPKYDGHIIITTGIISFILSCLAYYDITMLALKNSIMKSKKIKEKNKLTFYLRMILFTILISFISFNLIILAIEDYLP